MTTLKRLSEQIHRILESGDVTTDSNHDPREIQELIIQFTNQLLKLEYVNQHIARRENFPPHVLIAKYTGIEVKGAETGNSLLRCSLLGPDLYEEWHTQGGLPWQTPGGDSWITGFDSSVNVAVTEIEGTGKYTYTIAITSIDFPAGTDTAALEAEIEATLTNDAAYIKFLGFESGFPNIYSVSGITGVVVGANSITLAYDPSLTVTDPKAISDQTSATHALLAAGTVDYGTTVFDKMNVCTVAVDAAAEDAYIELPAYPLNLPRGQGIWRIYGSDISTPYIPAPSQVLGIAGATSHNMLSTVLGNKTAYEWSDRLTVRFNKTIAQMPGTVNIELLIVDPRQLSETDMLPITPEIEAQVMGAVLEALGVKRNEDLVPDNNEARR